MRKFLFLVTFLTIFPDISSAEIRFLGNANISRFEVGTCDFKPSFEWYTFNGEIEYEFKKNKLWLISGFAGGVGKEGESIYNGSYLSARVFRSFETGPVSVILSGGALYGLAGIQFDRTKLVYKNNEAVGYHNVSMKRNIAVPYLEADKAAILQPVFDARLRKYLGWFFVETKAGLRLARFSIVSSDFYNSDYKERLILMPSLGVGLGLSF